MNHPEYRNGSYLFSPVGDNRPAAFWPFVAGFAVPFVIAAVVHFLFRG